MSGEPDHSQNKHKVKLEQYVTPSNAHHLEFDTNPSKATLPVQRSVK